MSGTVKAVARGSKAPTTRVSTLRARILDAMVEAVYADGYSGASLRSVLARAKVSGRTFHALFASREECFLTVLNEGRDRVAALMSDAFVGTERWQDGLLAAFAALLCFFEDEPKLAWVWVVESQLAGTWAAEQRERNVESLTRLVLDHWLSPPAAEAQVLAAEGVMAAVISAIQVHLMRRRPEPPITLLGSLLGLATVPYMESTSAEAEMRRARMLADALVRRRPSRGEKRATPKAVSIPRLLRDPRAHRARACLLFLAERSGASNRQIAAAVGVAHQAQISTLLARLASEDLLEKRAGAPGHPNAWSLTRAGAMVARALGGSEGDQLR